MEIYIGNITEHTTEYLETLVTPERVAQSSKYRFEADRKRSLLAHALLNHAVAAEYPGTAVPVMPSTDGYGKPHLYIPSESSEFHFSLSHSGDFAVCAVNDSPVGVDIETVGKEADNIARRFFAGSELKYIHDAESFYHIWTLKESFMKVVGLGMKLPMDAFSITDYDPETGLCGFVVNGKKEHRLSDAPEYNNLIPFIKPGTDEFTVRGKCMTYMDSYSLAVATPALDADDINIIPCRF